MYVQNATLLIASIHAGFVRIKKIVAANFHDRVCKIPRRTHDNVNLCRRDSQFDVRFSLDYLFR